MLFLMQVSKKSSGQLHPLGDIAKHWVHAYMCVLIVDHNMGTWHALML